MGELHPTHLPPTFLLLSSPPPLAAGSPRSSVPSLSHFDFLVDPIKTIAAGPSWFFWCQCEACVSHCSS